MAEGLCRKLLQERVFSGDVTVGSAGIGDSCGNRRPAVILREFLAGLGIDVAAYRSKPLTEEIVGSADQMPLLEVLEIARDVRFNH
jgi:protein-tyrosine-phosphatase